MEQQTQKKEWKTPELIVLFRSEPEEAVLAGCKFSTAAHNPTSTTGKPVDCQVAACSLYRLS